MPCKRKTKKKGKMKKTYFSPETELIDFELQAAIMITSGGGISDDGSASKDDSDDTDPGDFGW